MIIPTKRPVIHPEQISAKIIVAIYARVSTEEQADNFSIPAQLDLLRSYCRAMEYEIYDEYIDPGYSGTTPNRPELSRLLNDAMAGKFTVVLVYRIDRFFRSTKDLLITVEYLDKLGVSFRSVTEPFDTSNPIGKFMLSLLGSVAQLNRDTFIENCMMGKVRRAEEGYVILSQPPFGWDYIRPAGSGRKRRTEKGYLVINEKEAECMRHGFNEYIKPDQSTLSVADYLNSLGYRTKKGCKWSGERVYAMLTNTAAIGEWWYKGETLVPVPKIMERDIFELTQQLLKERKNMIFRTTKRDYLLRGFLRCKQCKRYMGGTTQYFRRSKDGKRIGDPYRETFYYRCTTNMVSIKLHREERCPAKWVKGDELETQVLSYLSEILSNPEKLEKALSNQDTRIKSQQVETESKIKDTGKNLDRLINERERILEAYRSGVIEIQDLRKSLDNIKERQQSIEQQILEAKLSLTMEEEKSRNIHEIIEKYRGNWQNIHSLSFEQKRDLLTKTVITIWVETKPDEKIMLDIECIIPQGNNGQTFTIPPLGSFEQRQQWNSANTFDLSIDLAHNVKRDLDTIRENILERLKRFPLLTGVDMSLTIGGRLKGLREDTGLFIYQLAEMAGLAKETIRGIEHDFVVPRVATALKFARVFCVSPGVFLIRPDNYISEELTVKFRNLRYLLGLTQEEFAALCEIDPSSIREWELGIRELSRKSRYLIESILITPTSSSPP